MSTITIEVNGKTLEAQAGEMLIQVTDRNSIAIPRFCYHEKLSVVANCRMCLVEVERAPKPLPACATPVVDGMRVSTQSELARKAQESTMEFLLINHPLDCPVCDQGGECPLQDQAMGYGRDDSRFDESKRSVPSHNIGSLIATYMTRCIHCTRCVRFGEEVAGVMEMGAPGRGEHVKISTFLNQSIDSEVSGNMIDICPVGALTAKPSRFTARPWELSSHMGISPHDCLGTNINIQTLRNEVKRVVPRENTDINECWIADRDRFSYQATDSEQRLTQPMIKKDGQWQEVEWEVALTHAAAGLRTVLDSGSANDLATLVAPSSTSEEFYLAQKLTRSIGSENIDHRVYQRDFRDDAYCASFPGTQINIADYTDLDSVLLIGANIRKEQPLLSLKIRQAWREKNCKISALNPIDFQFNFDLVAKQISAGSAFVATLASICKQVSERKKTPLPEEISRLHDASPIDIDAQMIESLVTTNNEKKRLIILGALAQQHPDASQLKAMAYWLSQASDYKLAILAPANSVGGWLTNCIPTSQGKNATTMFAEKCRSYLLIATQPELDCLDGESALSALTEADFVVQMTAFKSPQSLHYADVLLPTTVFTETAGSYHNCEGRQQIAQVATMPKGEAKPTWKVLRVLGNFMQCDGFDYVTLDDVSDEINHLPQSDTTDNLIPTNWSMQTETQFEKNDAAALTRISEMPMYRSEPCLRHAQALQETVDNPSATASLNSEQASKLNLKNGDSVTVFSHTGKIRLTASINNSVPTGSVAIPLGHDVTRPIGHQQTVMITKN